MDWGGSVTTLGGATLAVLAMLGGAVAQSDGSDGRPYRGNPQPQPVAEASSVEQNAATEQPAARRRPARTELPRGLRNIPWDEPGKVSGVPGVMENSATDLPTTGGARTVRKTESRRPRAAERTAPKVEEPAAARVRPERVVRRPDIGTKALSYTATGDEETSVPRKVPVQVIRVSPEPPAHSARAEAAVAAPDAEARAKLIEQFRAKALAEERRRLEAEQSRDRHARAQAAQPRSKSDPEVTGAVTAAPETAASEQQKTSGLKQGVCRMLFFGILPGC
jgi:hypothetical protein